MQCRHDLAAPSITISRSNSIVASRLARSLSGSNAAPFLSGPGKKAVNGAFSQGSVIGSTTWCCRADAAGTHNERGFRAIGLAAIWAPPAISSLASLLQADRTLTPVAQLVMVCHACTWLSFLPFFKDWRANL